MSDPFAGRHVRTVEPHLGAAPEAGHWLWAMAEVRRGLLGEVADIDAELLDWRGNSGEEHSIGSLLYHVALIEASWLYGDILMTAIPQDVLAAFPLNHRTPDGRLMHVAGMSVNDHVERLAFVRERFEAVLGSMDSGEWHRVRAPEGEDYAVSPAWVVFHLVEHEAGHLFEIRKLQRRWREARANLPAGPTRLPGAS